jgi:hypothetical protein
MTFFCIFQQCKGRNYAEKQGGGAVQGERFLNIKDSPRKRDSAVYCVLCVECICNVCRVCEGWVCEGCILYLMSLCEGWLYEGYFVLYVGV